MTEFDSVIEHFGFKPAGSRLAMRPFDLLSRGEKFGVADIDKQAPKKRILVCDGETLKLPTNDSKSYQILIPSPIVDLYLDTQDEFSRSLDFSAKPWTASGTASIKDDLAVSEYWSHRAESLGAIVERG